MKKQLPVGQPKEQQKWIEVDATCFNTSEGGVFKTTLLINRCNQMKRFVKRIRAAVTLEGDTQDEVDQKVARYVEKPNVKLLPKEKEEKLLNQEVNKSDV